MSRIAVPAKRALAIVVVVTVGCGSRSLPPSETGATPRGSAPTDDAGGAKPDPPPLLKSTDVRLVLTGSEISLSVEHETGSVEPVEVGDYGAPCALAGDRSRDAGPAARATWAVDCVGDDDRGVAVRLVYRAPNLIVMRAPLLPGDAEELEYEVANQIPMPQGGTLEFIEP